MRRGGFSCKLSPTFCTSLMIWSSHESPLVNPDCSLTNHLLFSAIALRRLMIILSNSLTTQEVRLIGLNESTSQAGFPALRTGLMNTWLQNYGMSALRNE